MGIRLRDEFLRPYYSKGDCFKSLLARSTYLTKYCRGNESWTDTIKRVVEGNVSHDPQVDEREAERLFYFFWNMKILPPGRGLWTGGVDGMPPDSRYNCWYTTLRTVDDWTWTANNLMLGGGVGVGLYNLRLSSVASGHADLSIVCDFGHENFGEVSPNAKFPSSRSDYFLVPDSREGWVTALDKTIRSAWAAQPLEIDVSCIRPRGAKIRTFGGVACGPGPLVNLLRDVWQIVRGAAGRQLSSVEALDITNHIGLCIKSGNVRRSALITLGEPYDTDYRNAKKNWDAVLSHRHTSNNSLVFQSAEQIAEFDWDELVNDIAVYGEPGIVNLFLGRQTDPGIMGTNPCAELLLHDREACNLAEAFPSRLSESERTEAFRLLTRYCLRQRLPEMSDQEAETVRRRNMRIGIGIGGLCDFVWKGSELSHLRDVVKDEAYAYAEALGVARPIATTTVKPSGTISLLNGSSPGMHAPFAPYYIRRTRIAKNDPMAEAMIRAGVPYEDCMYDKTGHTWVFSFPCKSSASVYGSKETIREQFARQQAIQDAWADNAVSATLNFAESERGDLADCLRRHVPTLKSTSCLPRAHGYSQAPYEEIDASIHDKMYRAINHRDPLVRGGDMDVQECEGGVCPVR